LLVSESQLADAVAALRRGEVVGMPTETVYGLAGDAGNAQAIARIFTLKGRPADHPLIVHLGDASRLAAWARNIPDAARLLAERFWPGPLTLILERAEGVPDAITGGQPTVGVRVPSHPIALALLRAFGTALAAPSANRFGHVSPTTAQHVHEEFGADVPIVLDGGPCEVGIESTIVDLTGPMPRVLRPGAISAAQLAEVLQMPVAMGALDASPRVSGALRSHYAPRTTAELVARDTLVKRSERARDDDELVLALTLHDLPAGIDGLVLPNDANGYARHLYAALRRLDAEGADLILIEQPPDDGAWAPVNDRLQRATADATYDEP
jgi:L-threonylcarbamoyladenylate synthase